MRPIMGLGGRYAGILSTPPAWSLLANGVRNNFLFRMHEIVPDADIVERRFLYRDRLRLGEAGNTNGCARDFTVERQRSGFDLSPTDRAQRIAVHRFELRVAYPTAIGTEIDLDAVMIADRHQVIEHLRDRDRFVGIEGAPTQDVGLEARVRVEDRLDKSDPQVWQQIFMFDCHCRENI